MRWQRRLLVLDVLSEQLLLLREERDHVCSRALLLRYTHRPRFVELLLEFRSDRLGAGWQKLS